MATTDAPHTNFSRNQSMVLFAVLVTTIMMTIDITMVTVALPDIADDLNSSAGGLQWVIIGYTIGFGSLLQVSGSLSDSLGVRRLFLSGIVAFSGFSIVCGLAGSILVLNIARLAQGVAAAVMFAGVIPMIARTFEGNARARAIGYWSGAVGVAGVTAPVVGGLLVDLTSWRSMFWINVPVGVVAAVLIGKYVTADGRPEHFTLRSFDLLGSVVLAGALAALNVGLVWAQTDGWLSGSVLAGLVGAMILLAVFVAVERRVKNPILDVGMLRNRAFGVVATLALLNRIATVGAAVYLVILLQDGHEYSAAETGLLFIPLGAATMLTSISAGRLQARFEPAHVLAVGFGALATASAVLSWQMSAQQSPLLLLPGLMLWGAGNGLANAPIMAVATSAVPLSRVGMATGLVNSFFPIGAGVGTAVLGAVFAGRVGGSDGVGAPVSVLASANSTIYLVVAGLMVVATALALGLSRNRNRVSESSGA